MKTKDAPVKTNYFQELRSLDIDNKIWFVADDVTEILELDPVTVLDTLEDHERTIGEIYKDSGLKDTNLISESGLYALILKSTTEGAKQFRSWVTEQVLPLIRVRGFYATHSLEIPHAVLRFNDNYDRIDKGYFSVITELFIRLYMRFERLGYHIPSKALNGQDMRPEVSVGIHFDNYLDKHFPVSKNDFTYYNHLLPNGAEIKVKQYKNHLLPTFIKFLDDVWLKKYAYNYFKSRDKEALKYLPKLLKEDVKNYSNYTEQ